MLPIKNMLPMGNIFFPLIVVPFKTDSSTMKPTLPFKKQLTSDDNMLRLCFH